MYRNVPLQQFILRASSGQSGTFDDITSEAKRTEINHSDK
jgi:hypothetical protein